MAAARLERVHLREQELLVKGLLAVLVLMAYLHLLLVAVVGVLVLLEEMHQQMQPLLQRRATAVLVKRLAYLAVKFFMLAVAVVAQIVVVQQVQMVMAAV